MTEDEKELRFIGMDIKLFLRMAATNFPHSKDREVITKLFDLADQYASGKDITKATEEN